MNQRSVAEWEQIISEQSSSCMNVQDYCRMRGIGTSSFYKWRDRKEQPKAEFIELSGHPKMYELSVNGVVLKIPGDEQAARIAELAKVLGC